MSIIMLFPVFVLVLILVAMVSIGIWVYKDATENTDNPVLWTAVVVLVPNFLGLLVYLLAGRNGRKKQCEVCGTYNKRENIYCSECGEKLPILEVTAPSENKNIFIIIAVAAFIAVILSLIGIVVFLNIANF